MVRGGEERCPFGGYSYSSPCSQWTRRRVVLRRIVFILDGRFGQCFQCGLALHRVMGRLRGLLLLLLDELLELLLLELLLLTTESALALLCEVSGSHELLFLDVDEISDALGFEEGGLAALLGVVLLKGELEVAGAHGCRSSRR